MFSWLQTLLKLPNMHDTLLPSDSTLRAVREALSASVAPLQPPPAVIPANGSIHIWMEG